MPAQRTITHSTREGDPVLSFEVDGDLEGGRSVYFTDQEPTYTIFVKNISRKPTKGIVRARLEFDESSKKYEEAHQMDLDLEPNQIHETEFKLDMLAYQGNAAISIDKTQVTDKNENYKVSTIAPHETYRLYTFMVYDRDYYKLSYLRPRYAQYISAFLAVLIVLVGILQIL